VSDVQKPAEGSLTALVQEGRTDQLETRWREAVNTADGPDADLLGTLDALAKLGQSGVAETLAAAWVDARKAAGDVKKPGFLNIVRELLLRIDTPALRVDAEAAYRAVHAGVEHLDIALEAARLNPGPDVKKAHPKKAVRLLDAMLRLAPGRHVLRRGEDVIGEVESIDGSTGEVFVRLAKGSDTLTPDDVADLWEAVESDDFRVLEQLYPKRIAELAESDSTALMTALVRSRGGKIDSHQIKKTLSPKHIPAAKYESWWTKARAELKREPSLRMEGRAPLTLSFDSGKRSLRQETEATFAATKGVEAKLAVVEGYIRESARKREEPEDAFVRELRGRAAVELAQRVVSEPENLAAAVMLDDLEAQVAGSAQPGQYAAKILRRAADPTAPILKLEDENHWRRALTLLLEIAPETWGDLYLTLLPQAPAAVADTIVGRLVDAGKLDKVNEAVNRIFNRPLDSLAGLIWLWKGPAAAAQSGLVVPTRVNLLTKLLSVLDTLSVREGKSDSRTRDAKNRVKTTLSGRNAEVFRAMLLEIDGELASVVRRNVERCDALGPALRDELIALLRDKFKALFAAPKIAPWDDTNVIWTTEPGYSKKQSEYEELVNVKMTANARAIAAAREHGDLRENADYQAAKEEQQFLQARQAKMQQELAMAKMLSPHDIPVDKVGIGSLVTLRNLSDNVEHKVTLLGPWDADPAKNIFAYQVAMYRPLLGLKLGKTVELSLYGNKAEFRIEKIERGLSD